MAPTGAARHQTATSWLLKSLAHLLSTPASSPPVPWTTSPGLLLCSASPRSRACIYQSITPASVPNVSGLVPGQVYDVYAQCKRALGETSSVCTNYIHIGDRMCAKTFCRNPRRTNQCISISLLRGTTCGNKKWCVNARCVPSVEAGSMDESCPFDKGYEQPYSNSSKKCSEFPTKESWRCYDDRFRNRCCKFCNGVKRQNSGCPYGDRSSECRTFSCTDPRLWETCCGKCSAFNTKRTTLTTRASARFTLSGTTETSPNAASRTFSPLPAVVLVLLFVFLPGN